MLLITKQINKKFGKISESLTEKIQKLPVEKIATLAEYILDFTQVDDLETWLNQNSPS